MQLNSIKKQSTSILINKNDKAIFLFLGLGLWVFIPILGIFPLILFIHLNHKKNSKLNIFISLLVILTITIFVSSMDIISDTAIYVDNYRNFATKTPFEISGSGGLEFVLWLVSYPVYKISHGSNYAFVFFWFLVFNALTFWVIAKGFSPRNYGLLLLFIVSSPAYLGFQGFLVRQYLATLIFLIAIINLDKKLVMWGLYILSLLTHVANLIYLPMLLLYDKTRWLKSKLIAIPIVAVGFILPFSNTLIVNLAERIAKLLPGQYAEILLAKTSYYGLEQTSDNRFIVVFLEHLALLLIIFIFLKKSKSSTSQEKFLYFAYPILFCLMYIGKDIQMFSNRFAFLLFPFGGLFYYFAIEHKWKIFKEFALIALLTCKILYFNYFLYNVNMGGNDFHFLDDKVYSSSIIDYVELAHRNFVNDIKIKELPNRGFI